MKQLDIWIVGAGAVGANFAEQIVTSGNDRVSFVADPVRAHVLREQGTIVNGTPLNVPVLTFSDATPPPDLVILAVKDRQLHEAIEQLASVAGSKCPILSLLNGIHSEEALASRFGKERTVAGVVVMIDAVRSGREVLAKSRGKVLFGSEARGTSPNSLSLVRAAMQHSGIDYEEPGDMTHILWWKFMINVGVNPLSAVLSADYSTFQEDDSAKRLMNHLMDEVVAVAVAEGVELSDADRERWQSILAGLEPTGKTSMLQDVEAGRQTEVDMLCGRVVELGKIHGIECRLNSALWDMVRVLEAKAKLPGTQA